MVTELGTIFAEYLPVRQDLPTPPFSLSVRPSNSLMKVKFTCSEDDYVVLPPGAVPSGCGLVVGLCEGARSTAGQAGQGGDEPWVPPILHIGFVALSLLHSLCRVNLHLCFVFIVEQQQTIPLLFSLSMGAVYLSFRFDCGKVSTRDDCGRWRPPTLGARMGRSESCPGCQELVGFWDSMRTTEQGR